MTQSKTDSAPAAKPPTCPHCGEPLQAKGRIVDAGKYKKWLEEWFCPTHGKIELPPENAHPDK